MPTIQFLHIADQEANASSPGDIVNLSAVLNGLRGENVGADATFTLSSGDAYIPSPFFSASETLYGSPGVASVEIQNQLEVEAISFGNHEFDRGAELVAGLISGTASDDQVAGVAFDGTDFPYLSANLDYAGSPLAPLEAASAGAPEPRTVSDSVILTDGDVSIGVLGATTPTLGSISSPGDVGVEDPFTGSPSDAEIDALAENLQDDVDALLAEGVDVVVLLSHMQELAIEEGLATRLSGVDVIVGGGSDTILIDGTGPAAGVDELRPDDAAGAPYDAYPQFFAGADGAPVALVNTDGQYRYVGRLVLEFDDAGQFDQASYDAAISGPYRADETGVAALGAEGLADPEVETIAGEVRAEIEAALGVTFGFSEVFLNGQREDVRSQETNLGNLTADANLAYANDLIAERGIDSAPAVVSIKNGGGIRDSIGRFEVPPGGTAAVGLPNEAIPGVREAGEISQPDIESALSFNNGLTLLTLTRAELVEVIEHGFANADTEEPGRFPQFGGLQVEVDLSRAPGDRVVSAAIAADGAVTDQLVEGGEVVGDPNAEVRIVTLDFLAGGGNDYPFPALGEDVVNLSEVAAGATGAATFAPDGTEQDALAEYLDANFPTADQAFDIADTPPAEDTRIQFADAAPTTGPVINELQVSTSGLDAEFVELFGTAGASLDGLSLLVVESDADAAAGRIDTVVSFDGDAIGADGFYLAGNGETEARNGVTVDQTIANNSFENSSATYFLVEGFTGAVGDDLDTDDDGTADVAPWESVLDSVTLLDGTGDFVYGAASFGPDGTFLPAGIAREPDGGDFTSAFLDFGGAGGTPGATNVEDDGSPGNGGGGSFVTIMEIQGADHVSPFVDLDLDALPDDAISVAGGTVSTSGIVTAVDSNGFYLQDADGDGDDATSDALFVFTSDAPGVAVGDEVEVTGAASEFFPGGSDTRNLPTTQIAATAVTVTASGLDLPEAVVIGAAGRTVPTEDIDDDGLTSFEPDSDGADFFESLEAMRVTVDDPVAVSGTNRFGEIFTVADGGAGATGLSERGTLNISPDDFNPEKVQIDTDSTVSPGDVPGVDAGARLGDVTGVIGYDFGNFQVIPTEEVMVLEESPLTPEVTEIEGADDVLTVASYNVLNLDETVEDPDALLPDVFGGVDDDVADGRFELIAEQITANLGAPDIVGLQEIQDNTGAEGVDEVVAGDEVLQLLVDEIEAAGGPSYAFIDNTFIADDLSGGIPGGNIRTAYLYNPDRVDLVDGSVQPLGSQGEDGAFGRLPLVATFSFAGEDVTIVNNHFSSKGGSAPITGVEQPFSELQEDPDVNGSLDERRAQAEVVASFVDDVLTDDPGANVVVLGDLNEFEFVSPLEILEEAGLTNLTNDLPEDERYSFIFQGNSQSLDHILVADALADDAAFDIVHVNSEFEETDARASDHDPLVAGLRLGDGDGGDGPVRLVGDAGDDDFEDVPGDTVFDLGPEDAQDRNVIRLGDVTAARETNVVEDFDIDGSVRENSFDTLVLEFSDEGFSLATTEAFLSFVALVESDGDGDTDALVRDDDLLFRFGPSGQVVELLDVVNADLPERALFDNGADQFLFG